jgi:hypothetical protein
MRADETKESSMRPTIYAAFTTLLFTSAVAAAAPGVVLTSPTHGASLGSDIVIVTGSVVDLDPAHAEVTLNGEDVVLEADGSFTHELDVGGPGPGIYRAVLAEVVDTSRGRGPYRDRAVMIDTRFYPGAGVDLDWEVPINQGIVARIPAAGLAAIGDASALRMSEIDPSLQEDIDALIGDGLVLEVEGDDICSPTEALAHAIEAAGGPTEEDQAAAAAQVGCTILQALYGVPLDKCVHVMSDPEIAWDYLPGAFTLRTCIGAVEPEIKTISVPDVDRLDLVSGPGALRSTATMQDVWADVDLKTYVELEYNVLPELETTTTAGDLIEAGIWTVEDAAAQGLAPEDPLVIPEVAAEADLFPIICPADFSGDTYARGFSSLTTHDWSEGAVDATGDTVAGLTRTTRWEYAGAGCFYEAFGSPLATTFVPVRDAITDTILSAIENTLPDMDRPSAAPENDFSLIQEGFLGGFELTDTSSDLRFEAPFGPMILSPAGTAMDGVSLNLQTSTSLSSGVVLPLQEKSFRQPTSWGPMAALTPSGTAFDVGLAVSTNTLNQVLRAGASNDWLHFDRKDFSWTEMGMCAEAPAGSDCRDPMPMNGHNLGLILPELAELGDSEVFARYHAVLPAAVTVPPDMVGEPRVWLHLAQWELSLVEAVSAEEQVHWMRVAVDAGSDDFRLSFGAPDGRFDVATGATWSATVLDHLLVTPPAGDAVMDGLGPIIQPLIDGLLTTLDALPAPDQLGHSGTVLQVDDLEADVSAGTLRLYGTLRQH